MITENGGKMMKMPSIVEPKVFSLSCSEIFTGDYSMG